ncbi:DEAD/DEAH box helicase, partial [bacterium]|nr:DEAD/DEAH box helicase [bacterium]
MPKFTKEQTDAINKEGTNIIVSAGAGSGKTAVLTERVIRKIKDGVDINKLLVLTFTKDAAHEMKDRIRTSLKKQGLKEALDYLDSAYITTFDSYALSIVKKYAYVLNLDKNITIIDSSIINVYKNEIIDEIFETKYTEEKFKKFIDLYTVKDDT